jgi:DNA mismatch repair protein MutL
MARIIELPAHVANQIAAGEVVERPSSVVKELLENAIDAGARRIRVEVEEGGHALIRVTDDGTGMTREDAVLSLARHATSKIRGVEDLETVATFGFRGEALPSIASVSRFSLTTRVREETEGTRIVVEGGAPTVSPAGTAPGTVVEVRDLFFNVPARRKFLKRAATELSHIGDAVARLALPKVDVAFVLESGGRPILEVPAAERDPKVRLERILGKAVAARMFPIATTEGPIRAGGYVSAPDLSERTARGIAIFVNGRFVRDRTIQHAVTDAYRTLLERGRYPVVVLFLDVDPTTFDVNVHPQKTEVRFAETGAVHRAVTSAIGRTLEGQPWLSRPDSVEARRYALRSEASGYAEHRARSQGVGAIEPSVREPPPSAYDRYMELARPILSPRQIHARVEGPFSSLVAIGQILGTYLVCQGHDPDRMVVIDQHAAHERVAFERLRKAHRERSLAVQPLLIPVSIDLDERRAAVAAEESERLRAIGLELSPFGGRTWVLSSAPSVLGKTDLARVVTDVLDELVELGASSSPEEAIEGLLACAACHTVVRANDRLTQLEIQELLRQMDAIDFGAHCPHGRPVFREWSAAELERMFHRT